MVEADGILPPNFGDINGSPHSDSLVAASATAAERERCARIADQVAINAERRMAGHTNIEAKQSALDKMQAAQEVAALIRTWHTDRGGD